MVRKPYISKTIDDALIKSGITLNLVSDNIKGLAIREPEKVSAETILKANVELLKLMRAYPDKKSYQFNLSMKGKIKDLSYKEAQEQLKSVDSQISELEEEDNKD